MSGRSPSGVASLRARFEQNKESTSPPSRGRSPAGSAISDNSRPVSKVRTSFISVEGSGRMSNQSDFKESEKVVGEDVGELTAAPDGDAITKPQINGDPQLTSEPLERISSSKDVILELAENGAVAAKFKLTEMDGTSDANPDKIVSTAEDNTASMLPADPTDEATISGGAALAEDTVGLGSILKGSPFEHDVGEKADHPKPPEPKKKPAAAHSQTPRSQIKPTPNGLTNGKPKEPQTSKPGGQSKPRATGSDASAHQKPSNASDRKLKDVGRPAAIKTEPVRAHPTPTTTAIAENRIKKPNLPGPRTPTKPVTSTKQPTPNKISPKLAKSKQPEKDAAKDTRESSDKSAAISKPTPSTTVQLGTKSTSTAKPLKRSTPTSPKSASTKPRPKSPTRPAKLPAAATASTAASAAKLDGAPPSTTDRKPGNHPSIQGRVPSNPAKPQSKPARTSLPAGSKLVEKLKAPRPRQSMASSRLSEGSFLDRMMRPTQSSSQKTHEKVEVKTPPKNHNSIKTKRVSGGSDKSSTDHPEAKVEPAEGQSALAENLATEASETPNANPIIHSISAAAHTIPPTIPTP